MLESGANKHTSPLQCWVDDLIGFLDNLRDCFTPDAIDMLAGDRSEKVEFEHARERTYVQTLYETIDSLTQMTDLFIHQVAAHPDETPKKKSRSGPSPRNFQTINMVDENNGEVVTLSIDLSPDGWILSRAIDLTDDWCQLKHELQKGTLPLHLSKEVSAALVRAGTKEFGLTRAQELLLAAGEKAFQVLSLLESLRTIAQDKERLIKSPRLVEDSGIVAIMEELERVPCQEVDSEGRVTSRSFGRVGGCIRYFLEEARGFLHELARAQDEPDIFCTCERWFAPRDFQNLGLRVAIAINEAILSHWCSTDILTASDSTIVDAKPTKTRKRIGRPQKYSLQSKTLCIKTWEKFCQDNPDRPAYKRCFERHDCEMNDMKRISLQTNGEVTNARDFRCCVKAAKETRRLRQ
jgi:hypothetical protein